MYVCIKKGGLSAAFFNPRQAEFTALIIVSDKPE